jgi:hypothetical protein
MITQKEKTVFIEYSSSEKGQHFMTVINIADGKRKIVGRVYRVYDKENKKTNYIATDWAGNQIFFDTKDLPTLKKKFIKYGKNLSMTIPQHPMHEEKEEIEPYSEETEREEEIKQIRERNTEKEIEKEIER